MAYPTKPVYPCQAVKTSFHTFIRVRKEVFRLFRNYCGLLDRNQIVRHQRILDLDGKRAVIIASARAAKKVFHHRPSWPQSVNAELDYLPARPASPAADTEKALFRHDSPFFSLYIDNTSTKIRLSRYCTTAICGPAYSRDSSCGSGWAAGRPALQKWR